MEQQKQTQRMRERAAQCMSPFRADDGI